MKSTRPGMLLFCLLFVAASIIRADDFPPKGFTEVRRERSPKGNFQIVYFRKDPNEIMTDSQIWLQGLNPGDIPTQLLFKYSDDAGCVVSDDEQFIAVNNHIMDGLGALEIFIRDDGLFKKAKVDLFNASLKMMAKQLKWKKVKDASDFDHIACIADVWLPDGRVLFELRGNTGHDYFTWYFIYDAKKNEFNRVFELTK